MTTEYSIGDLNRDEWLRLLNIVGADDPKLAALASLSWGGNALKIIRVNATENGWELVSATGYTNEEAQDAVGAMVDSTLVYVDATPLLTRAALTGDATAAQGSNAVTVVKINGVSLAGLATGILKNTTGTGVPSIAVAGDFPTLNQNTTGSAATLTTSRNFSISGGGITAGTVGFNGSAAVVLSASVDAGHITLARMADVATATVFYRKTAGTGAPEVQTLATLKTDLGLAGTNSGDQTTIVGITGTKAQFDTAVSDGNIVYTDAIGVSVQAFDADLSTIAGLTATTDNFIVSVASAWASRTPTQVRTTLGLGTAALVNTGTSGATIPLLNAGNTFSAQQIFSNASSWTARFIGTSAGSGTAGISIEQTGASQTNWGLVLGFAAGGRLDLKHSAVAGGDPYAGTVHCSFTTTGFGCLSATTASAANVYQASSGSELLRSTSSLVFKEVDRDVTIEDALKVLQLRPFVYRSKSAADDPLEEHFGLAAEEVHQVEPRLVQMGYHDDAYDRRYSQPTLKKTAKVAPYSVKYERLCVLTTRVLQDHHPRLAALEAENQSLRSRIAALEAALPKGLTR